MGYLGKPGFGYHLFILFARVQFEVYLRIFEEGGGQVNKEFDKIKQRLLVPYYNIYQ